MAEGRVTQTGMAEARIAIQRLPEAVRGELRRNAQRTATAIRNGAKRRAPVLTGRTRDHIHMYELPDERVFVVSAGIDSPISPVSHHHSRKTGKFTHSQRVTLNMLPLWLEYGTQFMSARPFMRPATEDERAAYERGARDAVARAASSVGMD